MVNPEYRVGLGVTVGAYICLVGAAGVYGWWRQRRRLKTVTAEDELSAHYLSGRSLGTFVTTMTVFASLFSGYTAVGVPTEAFKTGWVACRWIPAILSIVVGFIGTGPRLRKSASVRNHQSPVDFITDRFASQLLRYTIFFLELFPAVIYLIAQIAAINATFNSMFGISENNPTAVIIISALILFYEWLGGLSSVAWTDVIQGMAMLVMYIILPITFSLAFGGWVNLDPMTYPQPTFYQVPSTNTQYSMWCFVMLTSSFFMLPHFMQRTYAAESMKALKSGYNAMTIGGWMLMLVGIFIGTMGVYILRDDPTPTSPFSAIMDKFMAVSPFAYGVACLAYTAALAGIMSTADSLLIAISQLFISEVVYPLKSDASPHQITIFGKITSLVSMIVAILITLFTGSGGNLSKLAAIQFGISLQAVPAFIIGLFATENFEIHPWAVSFGGIMGFVSTFLIYNLYNLTKPAFPIDPGLHGCLVNVTCCMLGEFILRCWTRLGTGEWRPSITAISTPRWDRPKLERFGEVRLTANLLWKMMTGIYEPFLEAWYLPLMLVLSVAMFPLTGNGMPPLNETGELAYPPNIVAGLPDWTFCLLMFNLCTTVILLVVIRRIPDEFPEDKTGEPDVLELTREEMVRRFSYDAPNLSIRQRRSTLCNSSIVKHDLEKVSEKFDEECAIVEEPDVREKETFTTPVA